MSWHHPYTTVAAGKAGRERGRGQLFLDHYHEWQPVVLDATGTYYKIALASNASNPSGTEPLDVAIHAHAYGGVPDGTTSYDWYVWAFRDGTITNRVTRRTRSTLSTHTGSLLWNMEQVYVVRVQVTNSEGNLELRGGGLPIHLGLSGGMGAETLTYRRDAG